VYDPHRRRNNTWLLRYYGVTGPLLTVTDEQMAVPDYLPPELFEALRRAADVLVVVAHASDADLARVERFARAYVPGVRARFDAYAAEGLTRGIHLSR
jgi:phage terminase small subunit